MAGPGGKRAGAGRPKGSIQKVASKARAQAAVKGMLPLDVMLAAMQAHYDQAQRLDDGAARLLSLNCAASVAKDAAPYLHPRLSSIEATGKDGKDLIPEERSAMETARALAWLLTSAAHNAEKS